MSLPSCVLHNVSPFSVRLWVVWQIFSRIWVLNNICIAVFPHENMMFSCVLSMLYLSLKVSLAPVTFWNCQPALIKLGPNKLTSWWKRYFWEKMEAFRDSESDSVLVCCESNHVYPQPWTALTFSLPLFSSLFHSSEFSSSPWVHFPIMPCVRLISVCGLCVDRSVPLSAIARHSPQTFPSAPPS